MRHHLSALAAGVLVSLAIYGILNAVAAPRAEPEDPWLDAWTAEGMKGQLQAVSDAPRDHLMYGDARDLLKGDGYENTVLRRYVIQNVTVQVVVFPRGGLVPEFPEGRHANFQLRPRGSSAHLCRCGRNLLLVKPKSNGVFLFEELPTSRETLDRLCDAFEKTAARYP